LCLSRNLRQQWLNTLEAFEKASYIIQLLKEEYHLE
jgi:hypothetical protein